MTALPYIIAIVLGLLGLAVVVGGLLLPVVKRIEREVRT
jgi:hypothetical protein